MERGRVNETWFNESQTTVQNVNTTIVDTLPTKNPKANIDWASEKNTMYVAEIILHCTLLTVGLFGNILTLAVLLYKKWTNITSRHILMALAVSDTIMIITNTFNHDFVQDLFRYDARAVSNIGCKVFYLFYRTSKMTSSWFVVFLCFERFIAVTFPLKAKAIITEKCTKIYIIVNYLIMTSFNIGLSFATEVEDGTCKKDVFASNEKSLFRDFVLSEMLLYSAVPIILMSIFTPVIILKLYHRYQAKNRLSTSLNNRSELEKQQLSDLIRTTTVLISVVIAFIVCVTPITVFKQVKFWQHIKKNQIETVYTTFMFREISQRFEQVNYCINFFLYIFNSPTFRVSVLEMLHIKSRGTNTQTSQGNNQLSVRRKQNLSATEQTEAEGPRNAHTVDNHSVQSLNENQKPLTNQ